MTVCPLHFSLEFYYHSLTVEAAVWHFPRINLNLQAVSSAGHDLSVKQEHHISMGECNTILSAYTKYRHLGQYFPHQTISPLLLIITIDDYKKSTTHSAVAKAWLQLLIFKENSSKKGKNSIKNTLIVTCP